MQMMLVLFVKVNDYNSSYSFKHITPEYMSLYFNPLMTGESQQCTKLMLWSSQLQLVAAVILTYVCKVVLMILVVPSKCVLLESGEQCVI